MRTLKESILSDIEDTLAQGDELDKNIKAEIKEFLKAIATAKNYEGFGYKNGRSTSFFVPNALKQMGYDANHIEITMYTLDNNYTNADDWIINIKFAKYSDDHRFEQYTWDKNIYMDRWEANKWNDIVRGLIKPASKSLDTFKKFLDNMEKWNGQLVGKQLLLK